MSYKRVAIHLIFATLDRRSWLDKRAEDYIRGRIIDICDDMRCPVIALGFADDHIHLFPFFHSMVAYAELIRQVKASSSGMLHRHPCGEYTDFAWQTGYGAIAVSPDHVDVVARYVRNQRQRHANGKLNATLERIDE